MKHEYVQAQDLCAGMVIVPPLRTMRHAIVERIKQRDGAGLVIDEKGTPADKSGVPRNMRNHDTSYVVVQTDIGLKSYQALEGVNVLVPQNEV
jgi:hypothetical protein